MFSPTSFSSFTAAHHKPITTSLSSSSFSFSLSFSTPRQHPAHLLHPSTPPPQHLATLTLSRLTYTSSASAVPTPKAPAALSSSSPPQLIIPTRLHLPRRRPLRSHHEPQQHCWQPSHHQPQPLFSSPSSAPFFPAPPLLPQPSAVANHNRHRPAPPSSSCLTKPSPHPAAPASLPPDHLDHDHSLTRLPNASHNPRQPCLDSP